MLATPLIGKSMLNREVNLSTKGVLYERAQVLSFNALDINIMHHGTSKRVSRKDIQNITYYIDILKSKGLIK